MNNAKSPSEELCELLPVDALPHGPGALAIAVGAAHVNLPAKAPRQDDWSERFLIAV